MITCEVSVVPVGTQKTSVSEYVAAFVKELKKNKNLRVELTGMGTQIEANALGELFAGIEEAREKVFKAGAKRVVLHISVDERRDKGSSLKQKKDSVNAKL